MISTQCPALGANLAYRFDGDLVNLSAEVHFSDLDAAKPGHFFLQLWANPQRTGPTLDGIKIAELPLQPLPGTSTIDAWVNALLPASTAEHTMGMALIYSNQGDLPEPRDLMIFPKTERFLSPTLQGNVCCQLCGNEAHISIEKVSNPRSQENLSGTLAIEVWALNAPYSGGSFTGQPVASAIIGILSGDAAFVDCTYSVPCAAPKPDSHLTLMLREWTAAGYVTRDYRLLDITPESSSSPTLSKNDALSVALKKPVKANAVTKKSTEKKATTENHRLSCNSSTEIELAKGKGISAKLARAIVESRPFASYDDLLKVKGMGPKLLEKLRTTLGL